VKACTGDDGIDGIRNEAESRDYTTDSRGGDGDVRSGGRGRETRIVEK
jgi:hypothetical protein